MALDHERSALGWFPLLGERVRVRGTEAKEESSALGLDEAPLPITPNPSEEGSFVVRAGCRFPSSEG